MNTDNSSLPLYEGFIIYRAPFIYWVKFYPVNSAIGGLMLIHYIAIYMVNRTIQLLKS